MSSSELRFSVVMPVYREGSGIVRRLEDLCRHLPDACEILTVYDFEDDPTVPHVRRYAEDDPRVRPVHNTYGRGPAPALRFGLDRVATDVVVVTMGDGSDDASQVMTLAEMIENGAVIAAASRYVRGGRQVGGPFVKRSMSRLAGLSLHWFAGVPIHDVTSAFKAYSVPFIRSIQIQSTQGFEISLELVAKAHRLRHPMAEVSTVWRDRTEGTSNFHLAKWLPEYLRWYRLAFGRQLSLDELERRTQVSST